MAFGEFGKIVRRIRGTALLRDKKMDQVTIYRSKMDCAYAGIRYPYVFSNSENPPHLLGNIVTAGICVWDSQKLVLEDGEMRAQSWRSHINVHATGSDSTVSAAAVLSNVHPAEWEAFIPDSTGARSNNAHEQIEVSHNTTSEEIDGVEPTEVDNTTPEEIDGVEQMEVHSAASLISALDGDDEKSVSVRQFNHKSFETVDIVASLDQITEMPYPLQEVQDEHKQKLSVSAPQNGFDYGRGVLTVTLQTILDDNDTAIEAFLVDDGVNKRLKPTVQVALADGWHRFAALFELPSS